jgi:hypothetical protein
MATRRVSRKFANGNYTGYDAHTGPYSIPAHWSEAKISAMPDDWGSNRVTLEMSRRDMVDVLRDALDSQRSVRNLDGIKRDRSVCNMIDARIERYRQMLEFVEDSSKPPTPAPEPTYSLNV